MPRAENLVEVYNNFVVEPLRTDEEFRDFYVERPKGSFTVEEIKDRIENSKRKEKYLFLGFRGSGKSTELNRLMRMIDKSRFIVICYSVKDELDVNDFDFRDFFVSMALKIYDMTGKENIMIKSDIKLDIEDFIMRITRIEEEEVERQKSYGISLSKFLRLKIGSEAKTREYIRKELETRISDLIQRLNWLIAEVEDKSSKKVVVVIDDLDKLTRGEQAEKFFYQNYSLLLLPDCFVVYTFPIPLAFNPYYENVRQAFDGSFILPQPPIVDREEKLIEENFEFYRKIAEKRMNLNLIDDIAMKEAILSTGKLSEFILIIREAAIKAYRNGREKITLDEIEAALEKLRRTYDRTLTERHKRRLVEIYEKKDARDRDEKDSISRDLLFSLTAVEYEDEDGRWCDINPILKPLLEKWKKEA